MSLDTPKRIYVYKLFPFTDNVRFGTWRTSYGVHYRYESMTDATAAVQVCERLGITAVWAVSMTNGATLLVPL